MWLPFSLLSISCFLFCLDTAAAESPETVQVWAVSSGLLPCPPVAAPQCGHGALHSGDGRSWASLVPPRPNGCPPLWACAALPPDLFPPPVSWAHHEAPSPNYSISAAQNWWTVHIKKKVAWEKTGTGKEAKEIINLLQSILDPG